MDVKFCIQNKQKNEILDIKVCKKIVDFDEKSKEVHKKLWKDFQDPMCIALIYLLTMMTKNTLRRNSIRKERYISDIKIKRV